MSNSLIIPDVSIIIVTYHCADLAIDCINSIISQTKGINYEVIVVDNNSDDNINILLQAAFAGEEIKFLGLTENIGFGRANNEGIKIARGKYIFCLNPDTLLLNNAIAILRDFMESHPKAGACGGNIYNKALKPAHSFRRLIPGIRWEINEFLNILPEKIIYKKNRQFNYDNNPIKVGYITGADLFLRRDAVEASGAFCSEFFMYYEETDLCNRIRKKGWEIYSVPAAKIEHLEGGTFDTESGINENRIARIEKGRLTYYRLNSSKIKRFLIDKLYLATLYSRALILPKGIKKDYWRTRLKKYLSMR